MAEEQKETPKEIKKFSQANSYQNIYKTSKRSIFINNLLGGIAWGLGSVIGASIIVGILGILIINTKKVPLLGSVVNIIEQQIQIGAKDISNLK